MPISVVPYGPDAFMVLVDGNSYQFTRMDEPKNGFCYPASQTEMLTVEPDGDGGQDGTYCWGYYKLNCGDAEGTFHKMTGDDWNEDINEALTRAAYWMRHQKHMGDE